MSRFAPLACPLQVDEVTAVNDFLARIAHYASAYEPLDEEQEGASRLRAGSRLSLFDSAGLASTAASLVLSTA